MESPFADSPFADSDIAEALLDYARRRGVAVHDDLSLVALLDALDGDPPVPHRMLLVAGTALSVAFRHDRALAGPDRGDAGDDGDSPFLDRSL